MMRRHIVLDKRVGETPLAALSAWKAERPEYQRVRASYAGRLDPMAEGKLLVLLGEECKKQKEYTKLDKEYEVEVLLDVGSDTGDALGIVEYSGKEARVSLRVLKAVLKKEKGVHIRAYPAFSSKTVGGKPLFLHALEGALPYIAVPEHEEKIYHISVLRAMFVTSSELHARVDTFLTKVPHTNESSKALGADFRIGAVRASWEQLFRAVGERRFTIMRLRVACGSGTYMRTLAARIGEALSTKALALSIKRTKIGRYACGVWMQAL